VFVCVLKFFKNNLFIYIVQKCTLQFYLRMFLCLFFIIIYVAFKMHFTVLLNPLGS